MPLQRYTGKDVKITFDAGTAEFQSIAISVESDEWVANASDTKVQQGGTGVLKATMTLKGWVASTTGGMQWKTLAALVMSGAAPSAFSWVDTATTPVTQLPGGWSSSFPLSKMRVVKADGGSEGPSNPSEWTATVAFDKIDAPLGL